jgi:hypothetical protein
VATLSAAELGRPLLDRTVLDEPHVDEWERRYAR